MTELTSGMPAHCSHVNSLGFRTSMCVDTAMYSAYAPPYARPNTSSPSLNPSFPPPSPLSSAIVPENSTPRILDAPGGTGYCPSRCRRSMRFSPNALILTRACDFPSLGLGTSAMWRFSRGPLPFFMSAWGLACWGFKGRCMCLRTYCAHCVTHGVGSCDGVLVFDQTKFLKKYKRRDLES